MLRGAFGGDGAEVGADDAAASAECQWPGETEWDLIASDYALSSSPDGLDALGMPYTIARFSTFGGDGSAQDPGGASDF